MALVVMQYHHTHAANQGHKSYVVSCMSVSLFSLFLLFYPLGIASTAIKVHSHTIAGKKYKKYIIKTI